MRILCLCLGAAITLIYGSLDTREQAATVAQTTPSIKVMGPILGALAAPR